MQTGMLYELHYLLPGELIYLLPHRIEHLAAQRNLIDPRFCVHFDVHPPWLLLIF